MKTTNHIRLKLSSYEIPKQEKYQNLPLETGLFIMRYVILSFLFLREGLSMIHMPTK